MSEIAQIQQAIQSLENQRAILGDGVVETALNSLREKLALLEANQAVAAAGSSQDSPSLPAEQRKLVTILFADLVGFTAMSENLDPEEVHDITLTYFQHWTTVIEQYGGTVEKFIGDAVMAVFGLERAGEAEPENAIRVGLHMRDLLLRHQAGIETMAGVPTNLNMRIGIHTGPVVVSRQGDLKVQDYVVLGDTVNLASRLQTSAPVNGILISHDTFRHVRGIFDVHYLDPIVVKGKSDPVKVYVVQQEKPLSFRDARRGIEGIETRMVGRTPELNHLQDAWRQVNEEKHGCLVTLIGEAGIGKSRLMQEFDDWLEVQADYLFFKGRAHPLIQNSPYGLLRSLLANRFSIQDSDPPEVVRYLLEKGIMSAFLRTTRLPESELPGQGDDQPEPGGTDPVKEAQMKTHFIASLLGFEIGRSVYLPEADPRQVLERGQSYLGEIFQAFSEQYPVVILLEDIHWADRSSLELVPGLACTLAGVPCLILAAARPSLFESFPKWPSAVPWHIRIQLEPLSPSDSKKLVEEIMQNAGDLPEDLVSQILRYAEGNPFYIEELIKMLIDEGVIEADTFEWKVKSERLTNLHLPASLVEVLQARFDNLDRREKLLLQRAGVIGRTFWDKAIFFLSSQKDVLNLATGLQDSHPTHSSEIGMLAPDEELPGVLEHSIAHLQAREIIFEREITSLGETREFFFKHALLRDVIYESLLKRYRRIYHALTAQWLVRITESNLRADEYASSIAEHYDLAGESASPLLASAWYARAARYAAQRYANQTAISLYQRSLELLPGPYNRQRYELYLGLVEIYTLLAERPKQLDTYQKMLDLLETVQQPEAELLNTELLKAETLTLLAGYHNSTGDYLQAIQYTSQVIEIAHRLNDLTIEIWGRNVAATAHRYQSEYSDAQDLYLASIDLAEKISYNQVESGDTPLDQASGQDPVLQMFRQRRPSTLSLLADACLGMGVINEIQGNYASARMFLEKALDLFRQLNHLLGESRVLNSLGVVENNLNHLVEARRYYEQALQIKHMMGDRFGEGISLLNLGVLMERQHQFDSAIDYMQKSLEICRKIEDEEGIEAALIGMGNNHHALGDYAVAQTILEEALVISRNIGDRQGEAGILTSLGELKNVLGEPETGKELLIQSVRITEEIGSPSEAGYAWYFLGRSNELVGLVTDAHQAYHRSYEMRRDLGQVNLVADSQAGIAHTLFTLGDNTSAIRLASQVIHTVKLESPFSLGLPAYTCLCCYEVLLKENPELAREALRFGFSFIQKVTEQLKDEKLKETFLTQVAENARIISLSQMEQPNG